MGGVNEPVNWDADEKFREDLKSIKTKDRSRYDVVESRCTKITKKPFTGDWKGYKMAGLYGEHVDDHWVILYSLDPELSPNNEKSHIDELYFHRVVHHDRQDSAVKNINRVGSDTTFELELPYSDEGYKVLSQLFDKQGIELETPIYDSIIHVRGALTNIEKEELREMLPDGSFIQFKEKQIEDLS